MTAWVLDGRFRDAYSDQSRAQLIEQGQKESWFHDFDFGDYRTGTIVYPEALPTNYHLYPLLDLLAGSDRAGVTAIDIGTYDGLTALSLGCLGAARVDATCQYDLARFRIARALSGVDSVAYFPGCDLETIELEAPKDAYDLVIASAMLHHLASPLELFTLARRLLRADGELIVEAVVVDDAPSALTLNTIRKDPVLGAPTLWLPGYDALIGMLELACLKPVEVIKLTGGRDGREPNYDRYTVRAVATRPGFAPKGGKLAEFHDKLETYCGLDFAAMRASGNPTEQAAGAALERRALNIWTHSPKAPLQPSEAVKKPPFQPGMELASVQKFAELKHRFPDGEIAWDDVSLLALNYPGEAMPEGMSWGLKQCGYLYVLDAITRTGVTRVLEIGPGFNFYLENKLDPFLAFDSLDEPGFYRPEVFAAIESRPRRGRFHIGLLGRPHGLEAASYDACVSVSALEHVPEQDIKAVATDLFDLTAPGGWSIHAIDCSVTQVRSAADAWLSAFRQAGFEVTDESDVGHLWERSMKAGGPLLESLPILFRFYHGYQKDPWARSLGERKVETSGAVLISVRRPAVY